MKLRTCRFAIIFVVAVIVVVAALGGVGYYFLQRGFSAREEPSAVEAFLAKRVRRLSMPRAARDSRNPVEASREVLAAGMAHWADHCAGCHGNDGRGATLIGKGLYPKPPDITQAATQQLTDGELYYIIENGIRFTGMPAFGEEAIQAASDQNQNIESWHLVHFIRHLPGITDEELAAMKKMNPKSPMELAREDSIRKFLEGDDSPPAENSHEHHH
jgi:mono/diheme cytochrome c family protein